MTILNRMKHNSSIIVTFIFIYLFCYLIRLYYGHADLIILSIEKTTTILAGIIGAFIINPVAAYFCAKKGVHFSIFPPTAEEKKDLRK